jgi:translation initiation factor 2B subunit (eIF-2B alpha/beta/delta family)
MVKPKNLLSALKSTCDLEAYIIDSLKGIDANSQKFNPDLILYVCNVIENWFYKYSKSVADEKISKKDIVIKILKKLVPSISTAEETVIIQIIEYLHSSGKIKAVSFSKWLCKKLIGSVKKENAV